MSKKLEITSKHLVNIKPVTDNQKVVFESWKTGQSQFLYGAAGTGKTFVSLYLALQEVLDTTTKWDKVIIVRSLIPTREIGFLPGDENDKSALYQVPYQNMVKFMFKQANEQAFSMLYDRLKKQGSFYFLSTSFLRGLTFDNSIILVDEFSNLNFHELDSIMTRVGENTKIMFCGDATQTDLIKQNERNGIVDFMRVLRLMSSIDIIEFGVEDIVRSGLVKEFILAKMELNL